MSNLFNTFRKEPKDRAEKEASKNAQPVGWIVLRFFTASFLQHVSQLEQIAAKQKDLSGLEPEALDSRFRKMLLVSFRRSLAAYLPRLVGKIE